MASRRVSSPAVTSNAPQLKRRPAATPEARENQMIALAVDLAERQLVEGTASAQVLTHYLKLGSSTEKLEQKKKEMEVELMEARKQQIASQQRLEMLFEDAMSAFRQYSPTPETAISEPLELEDDDYDDR